MLRTFVKKGSYQDSVVLMLLTGKISSIDGVNKVSIMMGTPANKDIFKAGGMETPELMEASSNDMVVVVDSDLENIEEILQKETDEFLNKQSSKSGAAKDKSAKSWEQALDILPGANLALISIPGAYAAIEADRALDENLNVFMFSDNVSLEDEARLKKKAHEKGLMVMGPDCGTGIIHGVPVAFANYVEKGKIGIVGASGTGIQELTTIIDRLGEGVTNAIGTGGRDLSTTVGGITMLDAINVLEQDPSVEVMIIVSKPPAKQVRDKIVKRLESVEKPVITLFLGEKPETHEKGFYHAYTLDEAARIAVKLIRNEAIELGDYVINQDGGFNKTEEMTIKAFYSGGTLAYEAAILIKDTMKLSSSSEVREGYILDAAGHEVIDLGDDIYTQGKPHPMIDASTRVEYMKKAANDKSTGVILFDLVLGYGSHIDMANELSQGIKLLQKKAEEENRKLYFVTTICGTKKDVQNYDYQKKQMEDLGVIVCDSNKAAVEMAMHLIGYKYQELNKEILPRKVRKENNPEVSEKLKELIEHKPRVINIGLKSFSEVLEDFKCEVVQYNWAPPAGGDVKLIKVLQFLRGYGL
ncbi:acyl-CoA synthetase FdrA [Alkaliphilus sp. B6464]|uniref:acyl-CoA synthetase FdrA n=1 Tax=Alkaliphilus sp. B6464 TaxID=2731219 RepID=UPI001BA6F35F|nr:acyl-CoA synthetase FdrA [Alkaliphilus sp. B6464]QUH18850.1 acyl-CoA synthetase FdrA [Alkaliphilus sp. B6464]